MTAVSDAPSRSVQTDVRQLDALRALWHRRGLIAATTAISAVLAISYALLATPVYRATTVVVAAAGQRGAGAVGDLGGLAALAGVNLDAKDATTEEAIAVLHSRGFQERFIADHNLVGALLTPYWDQPATWRFFLFRSDDHDRALARAVNFFDSAVFGVAKDKKAGVITVTVDWNNRNDAASWANDLVARVNAEMRSRALSKASAFTEYLDKQLQSTESVDTRLAISRLIEAQLRQQMLASVTPEFAFRTIDHALPVDPGDRLRPKRAAVAVGGTGAGFMLACLFALLTVRARPARVIE